MTSVINIRDLDNSMQAMLVRGHGDARYVYVGRPGKWGNPYPIGMPPEFYERDEVIEAYRQYLSPELRDSARAELGGKILVCWCKPLACHGDVLAELADA